jgi:hypothetical protein
MGYAFGQAVAVSFLLCLTPLLFLLLIPFFYGFFPVSPLEQEALAQAARWALSAIFLFFLEAPIVALSVGTQKTFASGAIGVFSHLNSVLVVSYGLLVAKWGLPALAMGPFIRSATSISCHLVLLLLSKERSLLFPRFSAIRSLHLSDLKEFQAGLLLNLGSFLRSNFVYVLAAKLVSPQASTLIFITGQAFAPLQQLAEKTALAPHQAIIHLLGAGRTEKAASVILQVRDHLAFLIFCALVGVVALNKVFVALWMNPSFYGGNLLCLFIAWEMGEILLLNFQIEMAFAYGLLRKISRVRLIEGGIKLSLQVFLASTLGMWGLPLAALASSSTLRLFLIPPMETSLLGLSLKQTRLKALEGSFKNAFALATGLALHFICAPFLTAPTWASFLLASALVGATAFSLGFFLYPHSRNFALGLLRRRFKLF